ncbi:DNA sulfur modification protein DndB, partial [Citrobacter sp. S46_ASV_140]
LFTLSSIKQATRALLGKDPKVGSIEDNTAIATQYWQAIYKVMPDWQLAARKEVSPAQLRQDYVHAHGIGLQALGLLGRSLIIQEPEQWQQKILKLKSFDWRKSNPEMVKRAMQHGKLSKTGTAIQLTCNALKLALSIPLTPEEQELEAQMVVS